MSSKTSELLNLLTDARHDRAPISQLPHDLVPDSIEKAYAVQDAVAERETSYGWKVGFPRNGDERRCAPLVGQGLYTAPCVLSAAALGADSVEVEIAVVLGADLPPRAKPYTSATVEASIGSLRLAYELVGSRFVDRMSITPLTAIADCQSNAATVLGAPVKQWQAIDISRLAIGLMVDGDEIAACKGGPSKADLLEQLAWLANHAAARHRPLKEGDVIITGARIGPLPLPAKGLMKAVANGYPTLELTLTADQPF